MMQDPRERDMKPSDIQILRLIVSLSKACEDGLAFLEEMVLHF